jgi:hypothetical protein
MSHLHIIAVPIALLKLLYVYHWPNITNISIFENFSFVVATQHDLTTNEIDTLFRSFSHVKQINLAIDIFFSLSRFLNNMPMTVSNVAITQPVNVTRATYAEFITREWLEQNTQLHNFSYSCDEQNFVNIWL